MYRLVGVIQMFVLLLDEKKTSPSSFRCGGTVFCLVGFQSNAWHEQDTKPTMVNYGQMNIKDTLTHIIHQGSY